MDNINIISKSVLELVKQGKMPKDIAAYILKEVSNSSKRPENSIAVKNSQLYSQPEIQLRQILTNILRVDDIDINENFYEMGIDSVIALNIVNVINKNMNIELDAPDILKYPSIKELANYIAANFLKNETENRPRADPKNCGSGLL